MASKYILSRDQFLLNESVDSQPLFSFLNEIGPDLLEMLNTIKPVLPESVSDEFIQNSQKYSADLASVGFEEESKLEHILYAMGTSGLTLFTESNFQIQTVIDQYYSINEGVVDFLRSLWNMLTEEGSPMGILHLVLDIIGFIPATYIGIPIDIAADGLNAIIYLFEGQYGSAIISAVAAAIPGIGDFAKSLKLAKGFKNINKFAEVAFKTGKADKNILRILAKEDPSTLAKFTEMFSSAKPVASFFVSLVKGIGRGIEALLRTWPISMLFGGIGKSLGKWLDEAVTPITKNLDNAVDEMQLISKGSDNITAAIKTGDASKIADNTASVLDDIVDELNVARSAGNAKRVKELEQILQTTVEKGLPGAGQFVKNGRLIDVATQNIKISDDLLKKGGKDLDKFLEKGWDEYFAEWKKVKGAMGETFSASDLKKIEELKTAWIEMRKAEALAAGLKSLDDIPADDLVKLIGNSAETAAKGTNFSAKLVAEISNDPAKLKKFFTGILADPKALAKLEEAGPQVVGLYRMFAKNPEVVVDIAKSGQAAAKHFDEIAKVGGTWTKSVIGSRFRRNQLIIAKNLIGAPLRCPVASLGQGNVGGLDALLGSFGVGAKPTLKTESIYRNIFTRSQFLLEEESADTTKVSDQIESQLEEVKQKRRLVTLGPLSYVDVCQSHINQVVTDLAKTATLPPADSTIVKNGPQTVYIGAGASSGAAIENQEAVDNTLAQLGYATPISSTGMLVSLPADATLLEVAEERIREDMPQGGLWYMLGAVMTNDVPYSELKSKIKSALNDYENKYKRTAGNKALTGEISFYPSPSEINFIKSELADLEADPSYKPQFFGGGVTAEDLIKLF